MTTETIDKLYLELSQMTAARNARELRAREIMKRIYSKLWCGRDDEPDSKLAQSAIDFLTDDMGDEEFMKWQDGQTKWGEEDSAND